MMLVDPILFVAAKALGSTQSQEDARASALQAERAWVLREMSSSRKRWFTQAVLPPDPLVDPSELALQKEPDPWDAPDEYPHNLVLDFKRRPRPLDHWSAQLRWFAICGRVPEVE